MTNRGTVILIVVLVLALFGALGYIGYDKYNVSKLTEQQEIYSLGANDAFLYIYDQAAQCPPQGFPITGTNNQTLHLIAAECYAQSG